MRRAMSAITGCRLHPKPERETMIAMRHTQNMRVTHCLG
jgi:hypothetical protein